MSEPYRAPAEPTTGLAKKADGDYYSVVLREKDFSLLRVGVAGGLGGGGDFPIPDFGDRCACCNAEGKLLKVPFDASTDRLRVDPIDVPVCPSCIGHLKKNTQGAQLLGGSLIPIVLGVGIWSAAQGIWPGLVGALVAASAIAWWIQRDRARRREMAANGHHPHLEILVAIGQCAIRTTNHRLAAHLAEHHTKELHRAR